jgi:preprotein translocase subunit SecE
MALEQQPKKSGGSAPIGTDANLKKGHNYVQEVIVELKKTTWPSRQEANRLTFVVISVIVSLGVYMAILDSILSFIFNNKSHPFLK